MQANLSATLGTLRCKTREQRRLGNPPVLTGCTSAEVLHCCCPQSNMNKHELAPRWLRPELLPRAKHSESSRGRRGVARWQRSA